MEEDTDDSQMCTHPRRIQPVCTPPSTDPSHSTGFVRSFLLPWFCTHFTPCLKHFPPPFSLMAPVCASNFTYTSPPLRILNSKSPRTPETIHCFFSCCVKVLSIIVTMNCYLFVLTSVSQTRLWAHQQKPCLVYFLLRARYMVSAYECGHIEMNGVDNSSNLLWFSLDLGSHVIVFLLHRCLLFKKLC